MKLLAWHAKFKGELLDALQSPDVCSIVFSYLHTAPDHIDTLKRWLS